MAHKSAPKSEVDIVEEARVFWMKNNKLVVYIGSAIVLIIAGWLFYKYSIQAPKIQKANDLIFVTQKYFSQFGNASDSDRIALAAKVLNGDGMNPGALKIINQYGGTPAANLCEYYAGACYLSLGQFDKAVSHLKKFDANGSTQIQSRAYGMLGDASSELKKNDDALNYYKKAANLNSKDQFTSSEFLFRAAAFAQTIGKNKEAIDLFQQLKAEFPLTQKGAMADRYLARLGSFSN